MSIYKTPKCVYVNCEGVGPEIPDELFLGAHTRLTATHINEIKLKSRSKHLDF